MTQAHNSSAIILSLVNQLTSDERDSYRCWIPRVTFLAEGPEELEESRKSKKVKDVPFHHANECFEPPRSFSNSRLIVDLVSTSSRASLFSLSLFLSFLFKKKGHSQTFFLCLTILHLLNYYYCTVASLGSEQQRASILRWRMSACLSFRPRINPSIHPSVRSFVSSRTVTTVDISRRTGTRHLVASLN